MQLAWLARIICGYAWCICCCSSVSCCWQDCDLCSKSSSVLVVLPAASTQDLLDKCQLKVSKRLTSRALSQTLSHPSQCCVPHLQSPHCRSLAPVCKRVTIKVGHAIHNPASTTQALNRVGRCRDVPVRLWSRQEGLHLQGSSRLPSGVYNAVQGS